MADRVDRRILGALRPLDGITRARIGHGLRVQGEGLRFQRTRAGDYAILQAEGLEAHTTVFDAPPDQPAAGSLSFTVTITDPARRFLPRTLTLALPRAFDPDNDIRDLMEPVEVLLAPDAAQTPAPSWAVVRAVVTDTDGAPVRGALVEVAPQGGGDRLAWGLTHGKGEAMVAVTGLTAFREVENDPDDDDDNEIVTNETNVQVRAVADPARPWPVNPDTLAAGGGGLRTATIASLPLAPGRSDRAPLTLDLS